MTPSSEPPLRAEARAPVNVAFAKYWGKASVERNVPAVPSISMTLLAPVTRTRVELLPGGAGVEARVDGEQLTGRPLERVSNVIRLIGTLAGFETLGARIDSENEGPTAAGLASSASGFAALVLAVAEAAGLRLGRGRLSALAREASASAARSMFGGFVELPAGKGPQDAPEARPLHGPEHWPSLRLVIALTEAGPKQVGSTEGMERTRHTSPFYGAWLERAPHLADRVREALRRRDLEALGSATEASTMAYFGCALAAEPPLLYWAPATLEALRTVRRLRAGGTGAWATMDAGPHVKVLCEADDARTVAEALAETPGVRRLLFGEPGPGASVEGLG